MQCILKHSNAFYSSAVVTRASGTPIFLVSRNSLFQHCVAGDYKVHTRTGLYKLVNAQRKIFSFTILSIRDLRSCRYVSYCSGQVDEIRSQMYQLYGPLIVINHTQPAIPSFVLTRGYPVETLNEILGKVNYQSTTYADTTSQSSAVQSISRDVTTKRSIKRIYKNKRNRIDSQFYDYIFAVLRPLQRQTI